MLHPRWQRRRDFRLVHSIPILQSFAQHIRADGSEAFPHNGSAGSTDTNNVRVDPSVSYRAATDETFLFWTEEDSIQFSTESTARSSMVRATRTGARPGWCWSLSARIRQTFVKNVQVGTGAMVFWVDSPGYGMSTLQAAKLTGNGNVLRAVCCLVGSGQ